MLWDRTFAMLRYAGAFLLGALTLSFFSLFQKSMLGLNNLPLQIKGFIVPIGFGGIAGLIVAFFTFRLKRQSKELDEYLNNIDNLVQIVSSDGRFLYVNQVWLDTLQYTREEVEKLSVQDILHPDKQHECMQIMARILAGESPGEFESLFVAKDGSEIYVRGTGSGTSTKTRGIFKNITAEREAQEFERLSKHIFAHTQEGLLVTNSALEIISANAALTTLLGYQEVDLVGKDIRECFQFSDETPKMLSRITETIDEFLHWNGELTAQKHDGTLVPVRVSFSAITSRQGKVSHYFCLLEDISAHKKDETKLKHLALYDPLTELPNRHHFQQILETAISNGKEKQQQFALFFLDLDGFKRVNDQYGHATGDQLLQAVARRLKSSLRDVDAVARLGGDEFGALLQKTSDPAQVRKIAKKLAQKISAPYHLNGKKISIATSIGVSFFPQNQTSDELLKVADNAMYEAKKTKGTWVILAEVDQQPAP